MLFTKLLSNKKKIELLFVQTKMLSAAFANVSHIMFFVYALNSKLMLKVT